jgi:hypothetical protein
MFYLQRSLNYNTIYGRFHEISRPIKTNKLFFSLYLLGTTYRTVLQQISNTVSKTHTNTSCVPKCCYQSVYCCLVLYFHVKMSIAKCFTNSRKLFWCEVVFENEHSSTREYTTFAPARFLRNWNEQRPSNQSDLDPSIMGKVRSLLPYSRPASGFIFLPQYVIVLGSYFKFCTLYKCVLTQQPAKFELRNILQEPDVSRKLLDIPLVLFRAVRHHTHRVMGAYTPPRPRPSRRVQLLITKHNQTTLNESGMLGRQPASLIS